MKKITIIIFLSVLAISCKTQSNIITSKKEAKEKGLYSYKEKNNSNNNILPLKSETKEDTNSLKSSSNFKSVSVSKSTFPLANQIVENALQNLGVSYKTGGTTKEGMDCSGLVYSAYLNHNVAIPRTSNEMSLHGEMISTKEAQPGDLIFFMTNGKTVVNHVGLIIEVADDEIKFIHSSTSKGVIISSTLDDYYGKTFAQINRVLNY